MLRFPNPGSTIANFVAVYTAAHSSLRGKVVDLDDIVSAVVEANLATSSGYMGDEAIARSTRSDRSRDPLYNQLKMYAELFRSLGWLHPTENRSLNYTFTLLGDQMVAAGRHWLALFRECVLGTVYPSRILEVKGDFDLRPFAFVLRTMRKLDDVMSRDEMIVGPLSASSDRDPSHLDAILQAIAEMRKSQEHARRAIASVSLARGIQVNTLRNYTRWPIAVLRDAGWASDTSIRYDNGRSLRAFKLTPDGVATADALEMAADIRLDQLEALPADQRRAVCLHSHYAMLDRAGFDVDSVQQLLEAQRQNLCAALDGLGHPSDSRLLVSPFQTISTADIASIFSIDESERSQAQTLTVTDTKTQVGRDSRDHLFVQPRLTRRGMASSERMSSSTGGQLRALMKKHKTLDDAAAAFGEAHERDTKTQFYPLISDLFEIIGYHSETSRLGVNYQRWDAAVWVDDTAIPIEIKSPTEERELSTKAIRQALENKVISLSRGGIDTRREVTSLIVGFALPAERSEMANLIDDIFTTYQFSIGVIAIKSLGKLAMLALGRDEMIEPTQLQELRGFLDV